MSSPMPFLPSMCCVCFESIAEGDHWRDAFGQRYDVHRGVCAIHAGHVAPVLQATYDQLVATICHLDGQAQRDAIRVFYAWAERVAPFNDEGMPPE